MGTLYPKIPICEPKIIHQVDFWESRYITDKSSSYSLNIMSVYTRKIIKILIVINADKNS